MARMKARRLTSAEKLEAAALAEEMLLERWSDRQIIRQLGRQYSISSDQAARILRTVTAEVVAEVAERAPRRRAQQIAALDKLYAQCVEKNRVSAAIRIAALLAKIEGHAAPPPRASRFERPEASAPVETAAGDEFEGRSEDDLRYYAEHGHWPEEAPEPEGVQEKPSGGIVFPLPLR